MTKSVRHPIIINRVWIVCAFNFCNVSLRLYEQRWWLSAPINPHANSKQMKRIIRIRSDSKNATFNVSILSGESRRLVRQRPDKVEAVASATPWQTSKTWRISLLITHNNIIIVEMFDFSFSLLRFRIKMIISFRFCPKSRMYYVVLMWCALSLKCLAAAYHHTRFITWAESFPFDKFGADRTAHYCDRRVRLHHAARWAAISA